MQKERAAVFAFNLHYFITVFLGAAPLNKLVETFLHSIHDAAAIVHYVLLNLFLFFMLFTAQ